MTDAEAKDDEVFARFLTAYAGNEGTLEQLAPALVDVLAWAFAVGRNYPHPSLPGDGATVTIQYEDAPLDLRLTLAPGVVHQFIGTEPDGSQHHVFLNVLAGKAYSIPKDEGHEPWKNEAPDTLL